MSFRARLALVAAAAVALAVVAASAVVYVVVQDQLYSSVDDSLRSSMERIQHGPPSTSGRARRSRASSAGTRRSSARTASRTSARREGLTLPVNDRVLEVARRRTRHLLHGRPRRRQPRPRDHVPVPAVDFAVQIARSLDETDRALSRISWLLILIAAGGMLVAAGLGLVVSRAALAPVRRLTEATETVTETGDLSERIEAGGRDELSRLGDELQHDARRARGVDARPAASSSPTRRTSSARR